jgi:molybdopterin molybdotransferase
VVAAGDPPGARLAPGTLLRIMTGAPLPEGADRVVPVERSDGGRESATLEEVPPAGANVRRRGEVLRAGDQLLPAGAPLTPGAMALLAAHGQRAVLVHGAPRVAVLATGDELVPADVDPAPGQLRDSNSEFLLAAGRGQGLELEPLGIAPDRRDALRERLAAGLGRDVLLVCGGVSAGEFDFVEDSLRALGCEALFTEVAMQPGRPLVAARHPGGLVFGLPGNPASVAVAFWLFVRPALRRLMGSDDALWGGALLGELAAPLPAARGRDRFLPASAAAREGRLRVTPHAAKGSHDLAAYARGNALVRVRAGAPEAAAGSGCEILPLGDWQ